MTTTRPKPITDCVECGHVKGAHRYDYDRGIETECGRPDCACAAYRKPRLAVALKESSTSSAHADHSHVGSHTHAIKPMCDRCGHDDAYHIGPRCHWETDDIVCPCSGYVAPGRVISAWEAWEPTDKELDDDDETYRVYGSKTMKESEIDFDDIDIDRLEKSLRWADYSNVMTKAAAAFLELHKATKASVKEMRKLAKLFEATGKAMTTETVDEIFKELAPKCSHGETGPHKFYDTTPKGDIVVRGCSGPDDEVVMKTFGGEESTIYHETITDLDMTEEE